MNVRRLMLSVLVIASLAAACTSTSDGRSLPAPTAIEEPNAETSHAQPTPTPEPTATPEPTTTPEPTATPAPTATAEPTATPEPTPTVEIPSEPLFEARGEVPLTTAQVNQIVLFVESEAGRAFTYPPTIVVQPAEDFALPGAANREEQRREAQLQVRMLQALDLTDVGIEEMSAVLVGDNAFGVQGYYDPAVDELYMPSGQSVRLFARVLVHELVHALDAQHSSLEWVQQTADADGVLNWDRVNAWSMVVEGRASVVDDRWEWPEQWPSEGTLFSDPTQPRVAPTGVPIPEALGHFIYARYRHGPVFIRSQGGVAETWHLLEDPPTTSEQIVLRTSPDEPVVDVAIPQADGPVLFEQVVGVLDLALILHGRGPANVVGQGWAGGAAVIWGDDSETCIRFAIAHDTDEYQQKLLRTLERWVDMTDDRTVAIEGDLIVATSCGELIP